MRSIVLCAAAAFALGACAAGDTTTNIPLPPVSVSLAPGSLSLEAGQNAQLSATVANGAQAVHYSTSDDRVASVSSAGMVSAVGAGTAVITATSDADANARASVTVTVRAPVTVALAPSTVTIPVAQTSQLTAAVAGTSNTTLAFTTSAPGVATVSASGLITALAAGTATITATSAADPAKTASSVVTVVALADLVVDAVTAPASASTGSTISVTATVRNSGGAAATAFQVGIYYSTDNVITSADVYSGAGCLISTGLAAGATTDCTGSVPVPATLTAGTYFIGAIADNALQINESSEANNGRAAAAATAITSPPQPDFIVETMTAGVTGAPGGTVVVTSLTRNIGVATTASFRVAFYFSVDPVITTGDTFSGTGCTSAAGLAANATLPCNGSVAIPANLAPGVYYVGAIADDIGAVIESNESNNSRAAANTTLIAVPAVGPDLIVSAMTAPATAYIGETVTVSATARNQSLGTTTSFRLNIYFSTDANITTADVTTGIGCTYGSGLAAGASSSCGGPIPLPPSLTPGTYFIGAIVDVRDSVPESDETNNSRAAANSTAISIRPIAIAVAPASATIAVGQTQQLSGTVTGAANTAVTWTTSAPAVATVSASGLVTAVGVGSATITGQADVDATKTGTSVITVTPGLGAFNILLTKAYVTQSVQTASGDVQLVAGKAGIIRAFVTSTIANSARPVVRVRVFNGATLQSTIDVPSTPLSVPFSTAEGVLAGTWNTTIAGNLVQPGLRIVFDVDPTNAITESSDADNTLEITPTVVVLPTFRARFVPIRQNANQRLGDVTAANVSDYMSVATTIHPIGANSADIRAEYITSTVIGSDYSVGWSAVLSEINVLRVTEDPSAFYYGVINPDYTSGGTGLGYVGLSAAMGVDWSNVRAQTVAHEWGHNFNRRHAPCGDPGGPDPNYPYAGGLTNVWGYDAARALEKPPTFTDLMGYCDKATQWISDYNYKAILSWRQASPGPIAAATNAAPENSLIVWGRITDNGVILEPAFEAFTRPTMPEGFGDSRIQGFDASGAQLFNYAINPPTVADLESNERQFAYAIPLRLISAERLQSLRLSRGAASAVRAGAVAQPGGNAAPAPLRPASALRSGSRVNVEWDARAFPLVVVRDPRTNEILSLARGGTASIPTSAATLSLQFTDGVRSTTNAMTVR